MMNNKFYILNYRIIPTDKDILEQEVFIQKLNDYYAYVKYVKNMIEYDIIGYPKYPIFADFLKELDKIPNKIDTLQNKITSIEKIVEKCNYYFDNKENILREIKLKRILEQYV